MTALELWRPRAVSGASRSSHDFPRGGVTNSTELCPFPSHGAKARMCPGLPTATETKRKPLKGNMPQLLLYHITEQLCSAFFQDILHYLSKVLFFLFFYERYAYQKQLACLRIYLFIYLFI